MPTEPTQSPPGTIYKLTQSVTTREYLLRPDGPIGQIFLFLLAVMSQRHGIAVHLAIVMSNHLHMLVTDILGDRIQPFNRDFFSTLTRAINVYRERTGNLLDPRGVNAVDICPRAEDVIHHGSYVANNAVEADLIDRAREWPGVNFLPSDMGRLRVQIPRPVWFFDPRGKWPEVATLELAIPEVVDCSREELRERMIEDQRQKELAKRQSMGAAGKRFLGRKGILRQPLDSRPKEKPPAFQHIPKVACKDAHLRMRMLTWRKARNIAYRECLERVRAGFDKVVFPVGTWFQHFLCGRMRKPFADSHQGSTWVALMSET